MNAKGPDAANPVRKVSTRDFVAVVFRRKWIVIGVFLITTAVTAGVILTQPTYWESTGKVLVKRGVRDNLLQSYQRTLSWEEELASEVETARSPAVTRVAQRKLDESRAAEGRERLQIEGGRVAASVIGESNVIAISYQDLSPEVCAEVTDAMLTAYIDYRQENSILPYPEEYFESEIAKSEQQLQELQRERELVLTRARMVDLPSNRLTLLNIQGTQSNILTDQRRDVSQLRAQLKQMHDYLENPARYPEVPFRTGSGTDVVISELKKDLVEKKVRLAEMERIYQPDQPEVRRLQTEVAELETMVKQEIRSRIRQAEMELVSREASLRETESVLGTIEGRLSGMPADEARLAELDRQIRAAEDTYQDLIRDSGRAKTTQATSADKTVIVLAPASAPYKKNTKDYVRMALAPIFSLIVGLGLAFFFDSLDSTVKNPREAEEEIDLPVLATLTEQKR